jgi:hypothetical protein
MPGICARLLEAMVADDARAVDRLPLLSDAERYQLLVEWNDTEADYPRDNACMSCSTRRRPERRTRSRSCTKMRS